MLTPAEYYRDPDVQRCVREYCGLTNGPGDGAAYIVGFGHDDEAQPLWETGHRLPVSAIDSLWAAGCDIARSLWDRSHLVLFLDLDYQNVDAPSEPFLRPAEAFFKLEPTYQAARRVLDRLALDAEHLMTGRGYHFTGAVPLDHPAVDRLAALVPGVPGWWHGTDRRRPDGVTATLGERHARAADGLGLVVEFLAQEIMREAAATSTLPVVINGTVVGAGLVGRECISVDVSHAGDPLDSRYLRSAFSTYQWHRRRPDIVGPLASQAVPPMVALPRGEHTFVSMLERGRTCDVGSAVAPFTPAFLPSVARGVDRLIDQYESSELAAFHREFLAATRGTAPPPRALPDDLTPCVRAALERPNDLLLKPEFLQQIVRSLMARDWEPAEIAAVVHAAYETDHAWGDRWTRLDARTRAEFDVRVFAGLIRTGVDGLLDCNCVSASEKGLCPHAACGHDLRVEQRRLLARYSR